MALKERQKQDIRRHLNYPHMGVSQNKLGLGQYGSTANWRFSEQIGMLEDRMLDLHPADEARLTGAFYGGVTIIGVPNAGDTATITVTSTALGSPVEVSYTAVEGDRNLNVAMALGIALANSGALKAADIIGMAPYSAGDLQNPADQPAAEVGINAPKAFTLAVTGSGGIGVSISDNGIQLDPIVQVNDSPVQICNGYIAIMNFLDAAVPNATQRLGLATAGDYKPRANELDQRRSLYAEWQRKLSRFFDVPLNPYSVANRSNRIVL
jgi:hypothetical protein